MKPQAHQEIYRIAYESANSELTAINEEFEKLRSRMARIEKLVSALKPLVFEDEDERLETPSELTPAAVEAVAAETQNRPDQETEPARTGADPFQHRINHVLGIGAGIRDVRSYTRQF
jgi:predicted  nucleic acid-binding Zn-ribbon protein